MSRMPSAFIQARWAVLVAALLGAGAIACYPGGTPFDSTLRHYSITGNFLSDLGMTDVHGRSNLLGATLFVSSLLVLVVGLGRCVFSFVRLASRSAPARWPARAAGLVTLIACAAFTGVAFTPENRAMSLHVDFTLFAWRILPAATFLLALASARAAFISVRVTGAWSILTAALLLYVGLLSWGPSVATQQGRAIDVIAQKLIAIVVVATLLFVSVAGERLVPRIDTGA